MWLVYAYLSVYTGSSIPWLNSIESIGKIYVLRSQASASVPQFNVLIARL